MKHLVTIAAIIDAVAATTGLTRTDLLAERRTVDIAEARNTVFWLARELTELSYQTIGDLVGGRDHSSVLAGWKRVGERRLNDLDFRVATDALFAVLRALESNKLLQASTAADPLATARRILGNPAREAVRVPMIEIVAMSRLIVDLLDEGHTPTPSPSSEQMEHSDAA